MKYLIKFSFPVEPFNTYVREGSIGDKIQLIMSELKPEVLLFGPVDGSRGCYMVVDMKSHSEIPKYAEPMFLVFEADL
ncbi:MAG TPA: panthothenate synthetase, partial [bacterium]